MELLFREYGKITLTEAGRQVLESARRMLNHAEEITSVISHMKRSPVPRLRVGVSRSFGERILPRLINEMSAYQSNISLDIRLGHCAQVEEWLKSSDVDIGIATLTDDSSSALPLVRDRIHVVCSFNHPLATFPTVHVRQLANEPLLMCGGPTERELRALLEHHGVTPLSGLSVDDVSTLLALAANGRGVTLLPGIAIPRNLPQLRALPLEPVARFDQFFSISEAGIVHPHSEEFVGLLRSSVQQYERATTGTGKGIPLLTTAKAG